MVPIRYGFGVLLYGLLVSCGETTMDGLERYSEGNTIFEEGLISTKENHEGLSYISPEKDVIIFTRSAKNFKESGLFISKFVEKGWSVPEKLKLSQSSYEAGIAFNPNKSKAFFTNKFRIKNGDGTNLWNIWEIELEENYHFLKATAKPLESPINSEYQDCCLTMNSNGDTYFASDRDGTWDIYCADHVDGTFQNIKKLNYPINTDESGEWPSYVNQANSTLWFSSIRKTGLGGDDIYTSHKTNDSWSKPMLLGDSINSKYYEDSALITGDGNHFFFSSGKPFEETKGINNIYISKIPAKK